MAANAKPRSCCSTPPALVGADWETADHEANDHPDLLLLGMRAYTKTGVVGRPSLATAAKGVALVRELVTTLQPHLAELRRPER
jgi:creatinine amidohydrolase